MPCVDIPLLFSRESEAVSHTPLPACRVVPLGFRARTFAELAVDVWCIDMVTSVSDEIIVYINTSLVLLVNS